MNALATNSTTIAFGILLTAALRLILLGFQGLQSSGIVLLATVIPLGLWVCLKRPLPRKALRAAVLAVVAELAVAVPWVVGWWRAR